MLSCLPSNLNLGELPINIGCCFSSMLYFKSEVERHNSQRKAAVLNKRKKSQVLLLGHSVSSAVR